MSKDLISRQEALDALGEEPYVWTEDDELSRGARYQWKIDHDAIEALPSVQPELPIKKKCTICPHCDNCDVNDDGTIAQPEPCDDPRADVYYLAEKIGIHRLYALVVELRGEPEQRWIPCGKCIHANGKNRWCKVLDRTINEDYFCYWAEPFRKEGETDEID